MITLKNNDVKVQFERASVLIHETADGIVFQFKDKSRFVIEDPYMPQKTKVAIRLALEREFNDNDVIIIDAKNYNRPISVEHN